MNNESLTIEDVEDPDTDATKEADLVASRLVVASGGVEVHVAQRFRDWEAALWEG